jgi:hypothetical protein
MAEYQHGLSSGPDVGQPDRCAAYPPRHKEHEDNHEWTRMDAKMEKPKPQMQIKIVENSRVWALILWWQTAPTEYSCQFVSIRGSS